MSGAIFLGIFALIPVIIAALLIRWAWRDKSESPALRIFACTGAGCLLVCLVGCPAILFPVFKQAREAAKQTSCMTNLNEVGRALSLYAADNGSYPGLEWTDAIEAELDPLQFACESLDSPFGYTFNEAAVGLQPDSLVDTKSFVLVFDGSGGKNRVAGREDVRWRHLSGRAVILLADGRASPVTQEESANLTSQQE